MTRTAASGEETTEPPRALVRWAGGSRTVLALRTLGIALAAAGLAVIWGVRFSQASRAIYVSGFGAEGEVSAAIFNPALAAVGVGGICIGLVVLALPDGPCPYDATRGGPPRAVARFVPELRTRAAILTVARLLIAAGAAFVLSSQITCSGGCPIPFTAEAQMRDTVHVGLAVLGFGAAGLAMLASVRLGPAFARIVPVAVVVLAVPALAGALLSLSRGNVHLGGWFELVATSAGLLWLVAFAWVLGPQLRASAQALPAVP